MRVKKIQLCIAIIEEGKAGCKMRGWLVKNTRQRARDRARERERESTLRVGGFLEEKVTTSGYGKRTLNGGWQSLVRSGRRVASCFATRRKNAFIFYLKEKN